MDLSYSPEYEAFRAEIRAFAEKHGAQAPRGGMAATMAGAREWQKLLIAHGYAARTIPKEYGGYGAEPDVLKSRIIAEEFIALGLPMGMSGQGISMLVPTLLELGSEEQKKSSSGRRCVARSSGAKAIPSRAQVRILPRSARARSKTATTSSSTDRKSGLRRRRRPT